MAKCSATMEIEGRLLTCDREAGESAYCILHDPDPNKDKDRFRAVMNDTLRFPKKEHHELWGTVFVTTKNIFPERTDRLLSLDGSVFYCEASFDNLEFGTTASFKGVTFKDECSFVHAHFQAESYFDKAVFEDRCSFNDSIFEQVCNFRNVTFSSDCTFEGTKFRKEHIIFKGVLFGGKASFHRAQFDRDFLLVDTKAKNDFDLSHSLCYGLLNLENVVFQKGAYFNEISVHGRFRMTNIQFQGITELRRARLQSGSLFDKVQFTGDTALEGTTYSPTYTRAIIFCNCDLYGLRIADIPFLEGNVEFVDCIWPRKRYPILRGRRIVHDEAVSKNHNMLMRIYRKLHSYYYDESEFVLSSDYYVGFLTAKRKAGEFKPIAKFVNLFYSLFSKYGESVQRPLYAIFSMWLMVPLILLLLGIRLESESSVLTQFKLALDGQFMLLYPEYWEAVAYNISLSTIFRSSALRPSITSWQHIILFVETILNGLFISFLALGIRRLFVPKKPIA